MRLKLLQGEVAELRSLSRDLGPAPSKTVVPIGGDPAAQAPAKIGRYVVVGDLGSGGQADVYRVVDPELGRYLVLKLARRPMEDGAGRRDALIAEGRLLAELDHPGLVRIFDVGIYDGRAYLVLEHVHGRNLEQVFRESRPAPREAARLIAEVAGVVAYAHRRGVIHGDITPRNILIDDDDRARLIDFGLSKIENAWGEEPGLAGGTPEFLPPEIAPVNGRPGRAGPASDVFGLGATLFWLLTGQGPFFAATGAEALERSRRCDIDFAALERAHVPRGVARICRSALAADPARRATAEVFADDLLQATRHWSAAGVMVAILAVVFVVGGVIAWSQWPDEDQPAASAAVVHAEPIVRVLRDAEEFALSNKLPLHTGEQIKVTCEVGPGEDAVVLWFNAAGELHQIEPGRDLVGHVDLLTYPAQNKWTRLEPPAGTELFLFCRGPRLPDEKVNKCFPIGMPLPHLPALNYIWAKRDQMTVEGPYKSEVDSTTIARTKEIIQKIERELKSHFKGVSAVAFSHQAPEMAE